MQIRSETFELSLKKNRNQLRIRDRSIDRRDVYQLGAYFFLFEATLNGNRYF